MTASANAPSATRVDSVDLLRGLVMVVMALDHTRDFFHWGAIHGFNPLDLSTTTPWLFFTRWITNYCAPTFMFLAGTGAFLAGSRGKPKSELSWFLVTRGLWLIFLELTFFVWFGWSFSVHFESYTFATLWALGWSMIVLATLLRLPLWAIATFGLVLIAGHNALDGIKPESWGSWAWLWNVLHVSGRFTAPGGFVFRAFYPLIPWVGVMALGYAFGAIYLWPAAFRRRWLLGAGCAAVLAFVLLRLTNLYGNLTPWASQPRPVFTVLSFLNVTKYPPSLCYLLVTLGPGLVILAWLEGSRPKWLQPFLVYGRVPFFYYVLHIPLIHAISTIVNHLRFGVPGVSYGGGASSPHPMEGFGLPVVYLVWIAVVVGLYPACRWFAALKRRRHDPWLSYL